MLRFCIAIRAKYAGFATDHPRMYPFADGNDMPEWKEFDTGSGNVMHFTAEGPKGN